MEDESNYDPDNCSLDVENKYGLYSNSDDEEPPDLMSRGSGGNNKMVCVMNDISWSETSGGPKMIQRNMDVKYNRSDEWQRTYYEWWRACFLSRYLSPSISILTRCFGDFRKECLSTIDKDRVFSQNLENFRAPP